MTEQNSPLLTVFSEPTADVTASGSESPWYVGPPLEMLCGAFTAATDCPLTWVVSDGSPPQTQGQPATRFPITAWSGPVARDDASVCGHLQIEPHDSAKHLVDRSGVAELARLLAELINQLGEARSALRSSTAELASQAPTTIQFERSASLGRRIESVLKGTVAAFNCAAVGMYLLNEETTELQLRATWGLSRARLAAPARRLEDATADLEAMLGHAVVLSSDALFDLWSVPEADFGAAVCVPISTASSVLGTLWVFNHEPREFEDRETNLLEILAGRLSVELEREALLRKVRPQGLPT